MSTDRWDLKFSTILQSCAIATGIADLSFRLLWLMAACVACSTFLVSAFGDEPKPAQHDSIVFYMRLAPVIFRVLDWEGLVF